MAPEEKTAAAYSYKAFEAWSGNQKKARVDWLLNIYQKRGWISGEEFVALKTESPEDAYKILVNICSQKARLRPANEFPVQIHITIESLQANTPLLEILKRNGIEGNNLKMRSLENADRLDQALISGTDRAHDSQNRRDYHGGYDGEKLAMIRAGVGAGQSTYVADIRENTMAITYLKRGFPVLIYSGDALENIGPNGCPRSNGFSVFHFQEDEIMRRSLLAVIQCY